jgi:DNA primase
LEKIGLSWELRYFALALLSNARLKIEYDNHTKPVDPKFERYRTLSEKVSEFYQQQLKNSPAKEKAVNYAKNRGHI